MKTHLSEQQFLIYSSALSNMLKFPFQNYNEIVIVMESDHANLVGRVYNILSLAEG